MFFNFYQVQGTTWEVKRQSVAGGGYSSLADTFENARESFLKRMWGGKNRPDRLSFDSWKTAYPYTFFLKQ